MEDRRVAVKTRRKRGVRRREGYINGDCRCGALTWVATIVNYDSFVDFLVRPGVDLVITI
jgi:hypothetical protein